MRDRRLTLLFTAGVCWAVFALALRLVYRVLQAEVLSYDLGGWPVPWGIEYRADALSALVILLVSGMGAIVITYAAPSLEREVNHQQQYLFCTLYLLCLCGLMGICMTGDLFNLFVFLEISSLSTYTLVSLGRSRQALMAAFQYLVMGSIGATFYLIGVGLLYQMTGTLNMTDMIERLRPIEQNRTILVAFGFTAVGISVKVALFPLHGWLPNAYTFAPSVVTAFIAATSTKVSVYILLRVVYSIFKGGFQNGSVPFQILDDGLMVLALVGIFVASLSAIYQQNIKAMLAYSSVAQIGYIILGISFATVDGMTAGIVHLFHHGLIKGGLFMALGCLVLRLGSPHLDDLRGAGRRMPWTMFAWTLGGLALVGVPLTAGFISKWLLLLSAFERGYWPVAALLLVSSLLSLIYVWRVVEVAYFETPPADASPVREAPLIMLVPTYLIIAATLVFGIWTSFPVGVASQAARTLFAFF